MKDKIISDEYKIAATEVLDVLNHLPKDIVNKIPKKLIEFLENVSIKEDIVKIDYSKGLDKIELKEKSKAMLAMIYRNYLCSDTEREEFDKILIENEEKYQKDLREKYNPDKIFEKKSQNEEVLKREEENVQLIVYKEKWYQKIFKRILNFIKK